MPYILTFFFFFEMVKFILVERVQDAQQTCRKREKIQLDAVYTEHLTPKEKTPKQMASSNDAEIYLQ